MHGGARAGRLVPERGDNLITTFLAGSWHLVLLQEASWNEDALRHLRTFRYVSHARTGDLAVVVGGARATEVTVENIVQKHLASPWSTSPVGPRNWAISYSIDEVLFPEPRADRAIWRVLNVHLNNEAAKKPDVRTQLLTDMFREALEYSVDYVTGDFNAAARLPSVEHCAAETLVQTLLTDRPVEYRMFRI